MSIIFTVTQKFTNNYMRNKKILSAVCFIFLLTACNTPLRTEKIKSTPNNEAKAYLWDLGIPDKTKSPGYELEMEIPDIQTATPQLIRPVDFENAFSQSRNPSVMGNSSTSQSGSDEAQWLYFSPAEFSTEPMETLYIAFENTGISTWNTDYILNFYAGQNPSSNESTSLQKEVSPGEQAVFQIPISIMDVNWKACWHLLASDRSNLYDFCYTHGNGTNNLNLQSAQNPISAETNYHPFTKFNGSAPQKYSGSDYSGEFISSSPTSGHDFKAYDHYEDFSVTFRNNGSEPWDSSFSLVFYSGYNWMHSNSFTLPGITNPGETVTVTMPMEIYEDNDHWQTCWYLSTPDGRNLADFCFIYHTSS